MSLRFDLTQIKDHDDVCFVAEGDSRHLSGVTDSLIMLTMAVGLGEITDKNAQEFYVRLKFLEAIDGPYLRRDGEPRWFTVEDVLAHVGLTTNVVNETRTQWLKRQMKYKLSDYERQFKREREKAAVPS